MKTKLIAVIFSATVINSNAALYTLSNGSGSTAAGVQTDNESGNRVFRSGTIAGTVFGTGVQNIQTSAGPGSLQFGYFSTDELSNISSAASLISLFTRFGSTNTSPNASFGGASTGGNRSVFSLAQSQTIAGTGFADKNIYLFGGNGATLAESTQFFVAKSDLTFLAADDTAFGSVPKTLTINPGNSVALIGSEVANVFTTNTDATTTAGWQMAVLVPEPSTALLGALGALGLLRRRRN